MIQKVSGKIVACSLGWDSFFFRYALILETSNGTKIRIRSKDAYPIDSYQTFSVKKIKENRYEIYEKPISFTLQKAIVALVSSILALGSIILYRNDILRINRAFFKEYMLFGAITCIVLAIAEAVMAKIKIKKTEEENPIETIEAMVNNVEEDYHTSRSGIIGTPYLIEVCYKHKGVEHFGITRRVLCKEPELGSFIKNVRIYEKTGRMENKKIRWDFYINLYSAILGFVALLVYFMMA